MLIELRRYRCAPGKRNEWLILFQETVVPYMTSKGMVVSGSFLDEADADVHIWMRRFDSEEHRRALHDAVYESDHWKAVIIPRIKGLVLVEDIQVTRLVPTDSSVIR
jgi:hypothetical protein